MTLHEYLKALNDSARQDTSRKAWTRFEDALAAANLMRIRDNFLTECRLTIVAWKAVFEVLIVDGHDVSTAQGSLTLVFQKHTLIGVAIPTTPAPFGRALEADRFAALAQQAGLTASGAAQQQFLDDLRYGLPSPLPPHVQFSGCNLGRYLIWSTFNEPSGGDPFEGCTTTDEVCNRLGLQHGGDTVLLVYDVPSHVTVRYPTLADAYAGPAWNPLFQA
ncbi:MAG: hypothetical protein AAGG50_19645, partial [Bacteroidota bacterium]